MQDVNKLTCFDICRCQFSTCAKVYSNEFTLQNKTNNILVSVLVDQIRVIPSGWLTKREELSFLIVLAFPKASSRGLAWMIWSSRVPCRQENKYIWHLTDDIRLHQSKVVTNLHFSTRFLFLVRRNCDCREILNDTFGVDGLSCAGFSAEQKQKHVFIF